MGAGQRFGLAIKPFQNDARAQAAESLAEKEIEKLDVLLGEHHVPPVNPIERAILITYIKAKVLGMLGNG
jgi:hypothetical protein